MAKQCQKPNCTNNCYGDFCYLHKPRKPIARIKRPRQIGKEAKAWQAYRLGWIERHPPDANGYWYCYLQNTPLCPKRLDIDQLTLDHVIPKGRGKAYKYDDANIKPSCIYCNGAKGSRTIDNI